MGEYVRQMPEASADLARRPGVAERLHVDIPLLLLLMAVTVYGLVILYSASGQQFGAVWRQARFFLIAYVVMLTAAQFSLQRYQRWAPALYIVGISLLLAVLVVGSGAKGAQRWLSFGGFRFQPSEIMKILVPLALASFFSARILPPRSWHILMSLLILALPAVLGIRQPDLGTAVSRLFHRAHQHAMGRMGRYERRQRRRTAGLREADDKRYHRVPVCPRGHAGIG